MNNMPKHIQIGDWIFEIKAVRALKVERYGQPYNAIANVYFNGDSAFIDGLLTKDSTSFDRNDFNTIIDFCRDLGASQVQFDRYKNEILRSETVALSLPNETNFLKVVN